MNATSAAGVRTRQVGRRARWHLRVVVLAGLVAALALPLNGVATAADSASAPVVKVGMITALTGPIAANPGVKDALLASIAAFNKRGGVGTNHAKLEADICDTR